MANQQHIEILKQGVKTWNQWRAENPDVEPDLSDHEFTNEIINKEPQVKLQGANLKQANFAGSRLRLADMRDADLSGANLSNANLSGAFLVQANLVGANLNAAILQGANFSDAKMDSAVLVGADLSQGTFMGQEFHFEKMVFEIPRWRRGSYFFQQTRKTILQNAALSKADLRGANLSNADLRGVGLQDANLYGAILREANLQDVDFEGANLYETNLNSANLEDANFSQSKLKSTYFINVDLRKSKALDKARHDGPSTLCLDTLFCSIENIPLSFLQGAGVPDSILKLIESFSPTDRDNPACFISYSSADQEFVHKLFLDLQIEGIRTWLVPDDMTNGDPKQPRIEHVFQPQDKLLFVFSEHSVNEGWGEIAIDQILEQERKIYAGLEDGKLPIQILFPIMVDNSITESKYYWAKNIREKRQIQDFTEWQNKTVYKSAFDRLLQELKNSSHQ